MSYFQRLRDLREDKDLKQSDIAKILQTTPQKISDYENGNIMMRVDKYMKLARFYNVSLDYLTGMIDEPIPLSKKTKKLDIFLSEKQKKLLEAYEENPELQKAVDKLLSIGE